MAGAASTGIKAASAAGAAAGSAVPIAGAAIQGAASIAALIQGIFAQKKRKRHARQLTAEAIREFESILPIVAEFAKGRDLEVGDQRAVKALGRVLSRTDRKVLAQLRERGVSGGAFSQAVADLLRRTGDKTGDLQARLDATLATRKAGRLPALTSFKQQIAQLRQAQANAEGQRPNPFPALSAALSSGAFGALALSQLTGRNTNALEAVRQSAGAASNPATTKNPGGVASTFFGASNPSSAFQQRLLEQAFARRSARQLPFGTPNEQNLLNFFFPKTAR